MSEPINVGVFNVLAAGMSNCGSFSSKENFGIEGEAPKLFEKLVEISKMSLTDKEKALNLNNIEIGKINKTEKYCDDITKKLKEKYKMETDTFSDCILEIIRQFFEDDKDDILKAKIEKAQKKAIEKVKIEILKTKKQTLNETYKQLLTEQIDSLNLKRQLIDLAKLKITGKDTSKIKLEEIKKKINEIYKHKQISEDQKKKNIFDYALDAIAEYEADSETNNGGYLGIFLKELSEQLQLGLFGGFIMGQKVGPDSFELENEIALTSGFQDSYNNEKPQFILNQIKKFFTEKNGDILVCPEFDYLKGIHTERYKRNFRINDDAPKKFNSQLDSLRTNENIGFSPVGYYKNKFNATDKYGNLIFKFTHFDGKNKASMNPSANFYRVIFYNKSKYSKIENLSFSTEIDPLFQKLLEDESERMELLLVTKNDTSKFLLFSCHLKSTTELKDYAKVKEKEIKKINSILAKATTKYKELPIVIAGDFNFPLFESLPNHASIHVEDVVSAYKTINGFDGKLDSETEAYEDLDDEKISNTVSTYVKQITRMKEQFIDGEKQELTDMDRDEIKEFKKAQELELQKGAIIKKWMDFMKTLCVDKDSLKSYNTTGVCLKKRFTDKQGNDQVFVGKGEKRKYNTDFIGLYHEGEEIPDYIQNNKIKDISGRTDVETTYCPYVLLKSDTKTIDLGTVTSTGSYIANSWLSDHSIVMRTIQLSTTSAAEGGGLSSNKSISSRKKSSRKKTKKKKSSRKKTKRKRSKRKSSKRSKSKKNKKKTTKK